MSEEAEAVDKQKLLMFGFMFIDETPTGRSLRSPRSAACLHCPKNTVFMLRFCHVSAGHADVSEGVTLDRPVVSWRTAGPSSWIHMESQDHTVQSKAPEDKRTLPKLEFRDVQLHST